MSRSYKDTKIAKLKRNHDVPDEELYNLSGSSGKHYKPTPSEGTGITKLGKLIARNANRTIQKRKRQIGKKLIDKELINA